MKSRAAKASGGFRYAMMSRSHTTARSPYRTLNS
jgi:hypothetical protein